MLFVQGLAGSGIVYVLSINCSIEAFYQVSEANLSKELLEVSGNKGGNSVSVKEVEAST